MIKCYLSVIIIVSIITFGVYTYDNAVACHKHGDKMRIPEYILLMLSTIGGSPGALAGMLICHHKTNKIYFPITIYFNLVIQTVLMIFIIIHGLVMK